MPLKREVLPLLGERTALVDIVGAANTVLLDDGMRRGFNTDVAGIIGRLRRRRSRVAGRGAGARRGCDGGVAFSRPRPSSGRRVSLVSARDPEKARSLEPLGCDPRHRPDDSPARDDGSLDDHPERRHLHAPGRHTDRRAVPGGDPRRRVLLDVAYDPWPSDLATSWTSVGGTVVSGLEMLLHQAIAQVRIFVTGDEDGVLPHEATWSQPCGPPSALTRLVRRRSCGAPAPSDERGRRSPLDLPGLEPCCAG